MHSHAIESDKSMSADNITRRAIVCGAVTLPAVAAQDRNVRARRKIHRAGAGRTPAHNDGRIVAHLSTAYVSSSGSWIAKTASRLISLGMLARYADFSWREASGLSEALTIPADEGAASLWAFAASMGRPRPNANRVTAQFLKMARRLCSYSAIGGRISA